MTARKRTRGSGKGLSAVRQSRVLLMMLLAGVMLSGCGGTTAASDSDTTSVAGMSVQTENTPGSAEAVVLQDSVTVTANSIVYAVPDMVEMTFGVQTQASNAKKAQEENTETVQAVTERLKEEGVEDKNIKTSGFDMWPRYNNKGEISGYQVQISLTVTDCKIEAAGDLITAAINAGADRVNGLNYSCSRYDEYYNEALAAALAIAKGKADTLCVAASRTLLGEMRIVEGYQDVTYRYNTSSYDMMAAKEEAADDVAMSLEPGEAEIKAVVTVTYGMK